jgi:hypothetical protein
MFLSRLSCLDSLRKKVLAWLKVMWRVDQNDIDKEGDIYQYLRTFNVPHIPTTLVRNISLCSAFSLPTTVPALTFAYLKASVAHRDVSPGNILIFGEGSLFMTGSLPSVLGVYRTKIHLYLLLRGNIISRYVFIK